MKLAAVPHLAVDGLAIGGPASVAAQAVLVVNFDVPQSPAASIGTGRTGSVTGSGISAIYDMPYSTTELLFNGPGSGQRIYGGLAGRSANSQPVINDINGNPIPLFGSPQATINNSGSGNILVGPSAALLGPLSISSNVLLVESVVGGVKGTAIYGVMSSSGTNLVLGNSTESTNRDTGGVGSQNIVKLLNGAKGASSPVGGGFFYVSAGALRWVGSSGTDTLIAPA